ncbi:MAG: ribose 5-phosphate isomerase B [Deltaproteobacteria bacterium]|nr:ribose 5-phosphate isomerase B [Deltaproteobacteria bacterium]
MKIALGTDHAGFQYKEKIKEFLQEQGHQVKDFGTFSPEPVDYPLFVRPAAQSVAAGESERGIVFGGSGNGEAIVANRIPGIRCTLCWDLETARLARRHNDANVLSLGARLISLESAVEIVRTWLSTPFDGGRHLRRIRLIDPQKGVNVPSPSTDSSAPLFPSSKPRGEAPPSAKYDVMIAFRYLKYFEGDQSLEFRLDPNLKTPSVIHVPSEERWKKELPEWARDRRDEILERLKKKCSHMECIWEEY